MCYPPLNPLFPAYWDIKGGLPAEVQGPVLHAQDLVCSRFLYLSEPRAKHIPYIHHRLEVQECFHPKLNLETGWQRKVLRSPDKPIAQSSHVRVKEDHFLRLAVLLGQNFF